MVAMSQELSPGDVVGRHIFGLARDVNNDPLLIDESPLIYRQKNLEKRVSIDNVEFAISGFGETIGSLYLTRIPPDYNTFVDTEALELALIEGVTHPRGAIRTPWNTILLSESKSVDARKPAEFINEYKSFYKGQSNMVLPYNYGWLVETIVLDKYGSSKAIKNYGAGRVFASEIYMMPDGKSYYLFDKDNAGILYLFIADEINSMSSGTLYGVTIEGGIIRYVKLGSESALKIKFKLKKIQFDKLFDKVKPVNGDCQKSFIHINTIYGNECLKVKTKNKRYVGLLEPIRMMAIKQHGQPVITIKQVSLSQDNQKMTLTLLNGKILEYKLGENINLETKYALQESHL